MNKAILMYHADKGYYPYGSPASGGNVNGPTLSIPGISEYLSKAPTIPSDGLSGYYAYIWSAGGAGL
jgi:hypothetical protein